MQQVAILSELVSLFEAAMQSFSVPNVFFFTSGRLWQEFRESLGLSEVPWNITSLRKREKKKEWLFKMWWTEIPPRIEKIKCKEFSKQCSGACSQTAKLKRGNTAHHLAEHTESDLLPTGLAWNKICLPACLTDGQHVVFLFSAFSLIYLFFLRLAKRTRCCFLSYMSSS